VYHNGGHFFEEMDIDPEDADHQPDAHDPENLGKGSECLGFLQDALGTDLGIFFRYKIHDGATETTMARRK